MFDYLSPKDGPVIDGLESQEVVYAKDQPEYIPLRTLKSDGPMGAVISRWTLTQEQRIAVVNGADIFLELSTFGNPLQPIRMAVSDGKMDCPMDSIFGVQTAVDIHDDAFLKDAGIKAS
jgi:hypothetical protein